MRERIEYWLLRAAFFALSRCSLPVALSFSRGCVQWLDLLVPRLRRTAYRNLEMALPSADAKAVTSGVFESIARMLLTFARFPDMNRSNISEWIRYEGLENYKAAKQRGRGVLIATAHLGNWELSAFAHALMTEPMHVLVRPLDNPRIDALVEDYRALSGNHVIAKKESARAILRALSENEAVGILIDQNAALDESVFVDFFGIPAAANVGFARIANRTGAAVIPGYAVWSDEEQRYVLTFEPEVEMTGDDAADTARIHARLEQTVRRYPDQWLWIHRRWKTRPPGAPPLY